MTGTTRPAIRPITKSKPLTRDEQNAGIDDGRHYETPKISPSAIIAIATVATPQTMLRIQRIPDA